MQNIAQTLSHKSGLYVPLEFVLEIKISPNKWIIWLPLQIWQRLIVWLDSDTVQMAAYLFGRLFLIHKQNHIILGDITVGKEKRVEGNVGPAEIEQPANFV